MKTTSRTKSLVRALATPVVRFCLARSISWQELSSILRTLFIQTAAEELEKHSERVSVSRLSAITGIRRPDITTALEEAADAESEKQGTLSRVVGQWLYDRRFAKRSGVPRPLTIVGPESDFAELTKSVSQDLSFRTILSELKRIGAVEVSTDRSGQEVAKLLVSEFVERKNPVSGFTMLAEDIRDLSSAVEENLKSAPHPLHLHARTSFDAIPKEALPEIREWLFAKGRAFHEETREFLAQYDQDIHPQSKGTRERARVVFATFSFSEDAKNIPKEGK